MASGGRLDLMVNDVASTSANAKWFGGRGTFMAEATFGGGSVKLQYKTPNGTFVDVTNVSGSAASLATAGAMLFELPPGELKVVATTATAVFAYVIGTLSG